MYQKIKILVVDDDPDEVEFIKSFFLPFEGTDRLYEEEKVEAISAHFSIKVLHTVPDAVEYIKLQLPDIAIVDINFEHASRHLIMTDEREEGIHLIEKLNVFDTVKVFCISNYIDFSQAKIDALGKRDWTFLKSDLPRFTQKFVEELKGFAARELASIEPEIQKRLALRLDPENWQTMSAKTLNRLYILGDLMAGWASLVYDENTGTTGVKYPENMVEIIQSLLPYADGEKT